MGDLSIEQTQELHHLLRPGGLLYKTLEGVSLYRKDLLYEILPDKLPVYFVVFFCNTRIAKTVSNLQSSAMGCSAFGLSCQIGWSSQASPS